jgi:hypothetical protein
MARVAVGENEIELFNRVGRQDRAQNAKPILAVSLWQSTTLESRISRNNLEKLENQTKRFAVSHLRLYFTRHFERINF